MFLITFQLTTSFAFNFYIPVLFLELILTKTHAFCPMPGEPSSLTFVYTSDKTRRYCFSLSSCIAPAGPFLCVDNIFLLYSFSNLFSRLARSIGQQAKQISVCSTFPLIIRVQTVNWLWSFCLQNLHSDTI